MEGNGKLAKIRDFLLIIAHRKKKLLHNMPWFFVWNGIMVCIFKIDQKNRRFVSDFKSYAKG